MSKLISKHRFKPHDPEICHNTAVAAAADAPAPVGKEKSDEDCGCPGPFSAKIQSQKEMASRQEMLRA